MSVAEPKRLSGVGLGLSDLTPYYRGSLALVEQEGLRIVELQPELGTWKPMPLGDRYQFLAVHASSQGRDIASPDPEHRRFAVKEHKQCMLFAHMVGADVCLLHPGHIYSPGNAAGIEEEEDYPYIGSYYWEHPEQRWVRIEIFLESLSELADFHRQEGFDFEITIENLPFPNLGATTSELLSIYRLARLRLHLKLTLDVPHLWISHLLLRENSWLKAYVEGCPDQHSPFYSRLDDFVTAHEQDICYFHIYGTQGLREHLPVSLKKKYSADELDLRKVAGVIGANHPVILEVFNYPRPVLHQSLNNFETLLSAA